MGNRKIKKVLIVRFSSIGDIVLTSPVIRCVKQQLNCEVHFITKSKFRSIVEHNPHLSRIFNFEKEITEVIPELKSESYDLILDLHKNLRSRRLIAALRVKSISFDKINIQKWLRVHTRLNYLPKKHLIDRYFEALRPIGIVNDGEGLSYYHGLNEVEMSEFIPAERYVSIVLGATYYTKRIPQEKIEVIINASNLKCVLLGGADVKDLAHRLAAKYPQVINQAGKLTLNQSAATVLNSVYCITGDTGLMHVAAAYKVPTMVFWGSTAYELGMFPYYGANHIVTSIDMVNKEINCSPCSKIGKETCPKGHFKCMLDLKTKEIEQGVLRLEN